MNVCVMNRSSHPLANDVGEGWTNTLVDNGNEHKTSSTHCRVDHSKLGRSKSKEDTLRPISSLSQTLANLPRASLAGMRSYSFKHKAQSQVDLAVLSPKDEDSSDDSSENEPFRADAVAVTDIISGVASLQIEFTTRQQGSLIRRRRRKQLSKGRKSMGKIVNRSVGSESEGIWDKFMQGAVAPEWDE